jgi:hypothetical protein
MYSRSIRLLLTLLPPSNDVTLAQASEPADLGINASAASVAPMLTRNRGNSRNIITKWKVERALSANDVPAANPVKIWSPRSFISETQSGTAGGGSRHALRSDMLSACIPGEGHTTSGMRQLLSAASSCISHWDGTIEVALDRTVGHGSQTHVKGPLPS